MAKTRAHLIVSGDVQGVCFRANARDRATELGLTGWVRNLPDGDVEALAEGEEALVQEFIEWCEVGPPAARVESVEVTRSAFRGEHQHFVVLHAYL
jgi:acylphosphatase